MKSISKSGIRITYNEFDWDAKTALTKKIINIIVILGIMITTVIWFIVTTKGHKNIYILTAYAMALIVLANNLICEIEDKLYNHSIPNFRLIDWINSIQDVKIVYKDNRAVIRYKTKLKITRSKQLEKTLKQFKCRYTITYVDEGRIKSDGNDGSNGSVSINIDTVSLNYILVDVVI